MSFSFSIYCAEKALYGTNATPNSIVIDQIRFDPNNIDTWISNTGILDQDNRTFNTPGFQWPRGSGKYALFTAGLTVAGYVNNQLRMAAASYSGEYAPGHIVYPNGIPTAVTDTTFKFYKVCRGDNMYSNPDWLNWGLMVPYGAPFIDVNHNSVYEPEADTPGVKGAVQTIFICMTDGFPENHSSGEGFGGGTLPLFAELHMTAWGYDASGYNDMQFIKWVLINKNVQPWNSTYISIIADPDLGDGSDDYIGCDTLRKLGYCYNATNIDGNGSGYTYGANPPAVGIRWLGGAESVSASLSSFVYFTNTSTPGPWCEKDPNGETVPAYYMMKGLKKDLSPWIIPNTNPPQFTKFCYSGDPETETGWTEYVGQIQNCGGLIGPFVHPVPPGDRRFIMSKGSDSYSMNPSDTQEIVITQLIARGTGHKNSVTLLKQLSDAAYELYNNGFVIGVKTVSGTVPKSYTLQQNYPNPFNPTTKIMFDIPKSGDVKLIIYDILGREIAILVDELLKPGVYEVEWYASNKPSGIYFYKLTTADFTETKKMVLIK